VQTLVIYDIANDRVRGRMAEACKDYGLQRIQWSAFMGDLNHNRREELSQRLRSLLGEEDGCVQVFPLCDKDMRLRFEASTPGYRQRLELGRERFKFV